MAAHRVSKHIFGGMSSINDIVHDWKAFEIHHGRRGIHVRLLRNTGKFHIVLTFSPPCAWCRINETTDADQFFNQFFSGAVQEYLSQEYFDLTCNPVGVRFHAVLPTVPKSIPARCFLVILASNDLDDPRIRGKVKYGIVGNRDYDVSAFCYR